MVILYLTRHGETEENVAHILQGHLPGRLTEGGREQACLLRDRLLKEGFRPDAILTSDLARASETADILASPFGITPCPTRLLRERDWGELTGCDIDGIRGREFPPSVETVRAMLERAHRFVELLLRRFDGKTVLAVSHGFFARCLQAAVYGTDLCDIRAMKHTEMRCLHITKNIDRTGNAADMNAAAE